MIQLKISAFPVTRTSSTHAVLFSILCAWTYLPLELSVSLNGDAGDVFADDSLFLVSSSRRSCALLVEQSFTHIADRVQILTVFGTCLIIHAFWLSPLKTTVKPALNDHPGLEKFSLCHSPQ